ncbi:MAG TPA: hypothetical protein DD401_04350 [Prevotella sp.]|nr:hypothetical protein [Prevotella sp.]
MGLHHAREDRPVRIAYIIPSLYRMTPNRVVLQLVKGMMARGHVCHVYYFDRSTSDCMAFPCETTRIRLWKSVDLSAYDVVHTHGLRPNLYVWLHPHPATVRTVATIHSYVFEEFRFIYGRALGTLFGHLFVRTLSRHDQVVTLSRHAVDHYARWIPRRRLTFCYNGVEDADLSVPIPLSDRQRIVAHKGDGVLVANVCFFDKIKGLDVLIRALTLLPPSFRLLLIGGGAEEKSLRRLADRVSPGRVLFLGSRRQASRYLPLADVFAQTSWSEGFCLSMAEAALAHVPIVSTDIPGMREKYGANEVTYFPAGDAQALARAIETATSQRTRADRACQSVRQRFTVSQMVSRYEQIYRG